MKHLEIDTDKIISMIDNHFENSGTNTSIDVDNISSVSISKSILELENFIDLKKQLMNELNNFFHNVMNYYIKIGLYFIIKIVINRYIHTVIIYLL